MKVSTITELPQRQPNFTTLETNLKPLLVSMKILGVYFDPPSILGPEEKDAIRNCLKRKKLAWIFSRFSLRAYCMICLVFIWGNFIRAVAGLLPSDEHMHLRVIMTVWYLQCSLSSTIILLSCARLRHLRAFFKQWDDLFGDSVTREIGWHFQQTPRFFKVVVGIGWFFLIFSSILVYAILLLGSKESKLFREQMARPMSPNMIYEAVYMLAQFFSTGATIFSIIFVATLSRILSVQFTRFKCCLSKKIKEADGNVPHYLPEFRIRYMRLCQVVECLNGSFKWLLGVTFLLQITEMCFVSYVIINNNVFNVFYISNNVLWLIICLAIVVTLTISSAHVHEAAHSLLEPLHQMQTSNITLSQIGQLQMFLSKLSATSIGFTAGDFFLITREFMLTLGGLYITYFFLLLQFKTG